MPAELTPEYGDNVALAYGLTAREVGAIVVSLIELRRTLVLNSHELTKLRDEYSAIEMAQNAKLVDRDRDRAFAGVVVNLLIAAGQYEMATRVFSEFINRGPEFTKEVADFIINKIR